MPFAGCGIEMFKILISLEKKKKKQTNRCAYCNFVREILPRLDKDHHEIDPSRCLQIPHIGLKLMPAAMQQDAPGIMQSPSVGIPSIGTATYVLFDEIQDIPGQQCYPLFLISPVTGRSRLTNHERHSTLEQELIGALESDTKRSNGGKISEKKIQNLLRE